MIGIGGGLIDEAKKLPHFLADKFLSDPKPGTYRLELKLELPEGWTERITAALSRAAYSIG